MSLPRHVNYSPLVLSNRDSCSTLSHWLLLSSFTWVSSPSILLSSSVTAAPSVSIPPPLSPTPSTSPARAPPLPSCSFPPPPPLLLPPSLLLLLMYAWSGRLKPVQTHYVIHVQYIPIYNVHTYIISHIVSVDTLKTEFEHSVQHSEHNMLPRMRYLQTYGVEFPETCAPRNRLPETWDMGGTAQDGTWWHSSSCK